MKRYLIAGILVWLPLAVTIWVLLWALNLLNGIFGGLTQLTISIFPAATDFIIHLRDNPIAGPIFVAALLLLTGIFVTNFIGKWLFGVWDKMMLKIPIVKSIYSSVKQVSDTLFSSSGQAFREAVLVQYPRHGSWTIAFVTGSPVGEVGKHLHDLAPNQSDKPEWISVYVPTTPNPTSGFFLMMPKNEVRPLSMSVDQALKYVISMGVVGPDLQTPSALPAFEKLPSPEKA